MSQDSLATASESLDVTRLARAGLTDIVAGIDARFMQVGCMLATAVETIDRIVLTLKDVTTVFETGDAAAAVGNLTGAAQRLSAVSAQVSQRTTEIKGIRAASKSLCDHVAEVRKALEVLQIYGINVKIAASGADAFVDFAERMKLQLTAGELHINGFDVKLEELEQSLTGMEQCDELLAIECMKVVPHVPQRLIADANELRTHQVRLAELAAETSELARSIQGNVGAVLGAIQIGDIARQRLEHILAGCTLLETHLALSDCEAEEVTRHHMMRLFAAQLLDTAEDFRRETEHLVASLRNMGPQASRLLTLQRGSGTADDGQIFLRRLEAGIAEADAMTGQLRRADSQAEETVRIIVGTVDDLAIRAKAVRNLRIDVQQMAINIGLRCRRVELIGRPVTVIANEIRSYSEKLDETIDNISAATDDLNVISLRMRERAAESHARPGDELGQSLHAIREGARRTEEAMAAAGDEAGEILGMLRLTTDELEGSLDLGGTIDAIASSLAALAGPEGVVSDRPDHPLRLLLTELGRSYTMAREREIHDRFRLPGMDSLAEASGANVDRLDDDDDALFDDALF